MAIESNEACPTCVANGGDKTGNHLMVYGDGAAYCNRCETYISAEERGGEPKKAPLMTRDVLSSSPASQFSMESVEELSPAAARGLSANYMEMYDHRVAFDEATREPTHIFYPRHQQGVHSGWKIREISSKNFYSIGDGKNADLIGMQVEGGKRLCVIVEGEDDLVAAKQMIGTGSNWYDNKGRDYTVVSTPNGAHKSEGANKLNKYSYEWLTNFKTIIIASDMDDAGDQFAKDIAAMFPVGKCKRATLPVKDARDALTGELGRDFVGALGNAAVLTIDGVVMGSSTWGSVLKSYRANQDGGVPYPFPELNDQIYGRRKGELDLFTSGSGNGKTQLFREIINDDIQVHGNKVGILSLEESITDTMLGQMSIIADMPLHLPEVRSQVSDEQLEKYWQEVNQNDRMVLFNHFGSLTGDKLTDKLRYMIAGMGCEYLYLDHISIVISEYAADGQERQAIDTLMTKLKNLTQEYGVWQGVISHLRKTGSGPSFEEGAVPSLDDLRGSGSLKQLSHGVIALSRNQQDPCPIKRNTTQVTVLKNRFCGRTGPAGLLYYNPDTGRLLPSTMTQEEFTEKTSPLVRSNSI